VDAGQATLSRDIHELGLVKTDNGYAVRQNGASSDSALPPVSRLVARVRYQYPGGSGICSY